MKHSQKPSAIKNLQNRNNRLFLTIITVIGSALFLVIILLLLTNQQIKQLQTFRQELLSLRKSQLSSSSVRTYVENHRQEIQLILDALPNETNILDFLQNVEALVKEYDESGSVTFSAIRPEKVNNQLSIPIAVQFKASPASTIDFLRRFEKLPYLMKITSIDMNINQGITNKADLVISARVYVQDPFR